MTADAFDSEAVADGGDRLERPQHKLTVVVSLAQVPCEALESRFAVGYQKVVL